MRDRDAQAKARQLALLALELEKLLPKVRAKLRTWQAAGYPSGTGESSIGGTRKSDPVGRAVEQAVDNGKPIDPEGAQLRNVDDELVAIERRLDGLVADLQAVDRVYADGGEDGCELCENARRPVDDDGRPLHECDRKCREAGHPHPNRTQPVYSRTAPKPADGLDPVPPRRRCSWHYDFVIRNGEDAHRELTVWHLDHLGQRTPTTLLERFHPDAVARLRNRKATA